MNMRAKLLSVLLIVSCTPLAAEQTEQKGFWQRLKSTMYNYRGSLSATGMGLFVFLVMRESIASGRLTRISVNDVTVNNPAEEPLGYAAVVFPWLGRFIIRFDNTSRADICANIGQNFPLVSVLQMGIKWVSIPAIPVECSIPVDFPS